MESKAELHGNYPRVTFTLHIRRMPRYYILSLILPCCLLAFVSVATFLLEPGNGDRLGIGTCVGDTIVKDKKHLKNVGPIRDCEPPHAHSPGVATGTVARRLRIDVHDDNDNDNA